MNSCVKVNVLEQFFSDSLSESENQTLVDHLDVCPACRERADLICVEGELRDLHRSSLKKQFTKSEVSIPDVLRQRLYALHVSSEEALPVDDEAECASGEKIQKRVADETLSINLEKTKLDDDRTSNRRIVGKYRLVRELGHGAMGTVFEAVHTKLNKSVALKVLEHSRSLKTESVERFNREMKVLAQHDHPNIVKAIDAGDEEGALYLVMDLIDGENLARVVRRCGALSMADACDIAMQVAAGLQHAHESGFIHRDIKASNLMLSEEGNVKILDFGLSRLQGDEESHLNLTQTGLLIGTVPYMAPELFEDRNNADIRSDLYALGCTLYCLLAGDTPFSSRKYTSPLQQMNAHTNKPVPPIQNYRPDVSDALVAVVNRLLSKDPDARFQSPVEVVEALGPFSAESDLPALLEKTRQISDDEPDVMPTVPVKPALRSGEQKLTLELALDLLPPGGRSKVRSLFLGASVLFLAALGSVIYVNTGEGKLEITINDKDAKVTIDGSALPLIVVESSEGKCTIKTKKLPSGKHILVAEKDGFVTETQDFRLFRNSREEVSVKLISVSGDRGVATLVLRTGGKVTLLGKETEIQSENDLPSQDFSISEISMKGVHRSQISDEMLEELFKGLKTLQNLEDLNLSSLRVTDDEMKHFQGLPKLKQLNVQWAPITDEGLKSLRNLPNLENLWLCETQITDQGLESLKKFSKLRGLALKGTKISDTGIRHIAHLKKLAGLYLARTRITSAGVEDLGTLPRLEFLDLQGTSLNEADLRSLRNSLPKECEILK